MSTPAPRPDPGKAARCRSNRVLVTLPLEVGGELVDQLQEELNELGHNLVYAAASIVQRSADAPCLQALIHVAAAHLLAKQGTPAKWKSMLPCLLQASFENAGPRVDQVLSQHLMERGEFAFEMGTPQEARTKEDHFAALSKCTSMKQVAALDPEMFVRCYSQLESITYKNKLEGNKGIPIKQLNRWQWIVHDRLMAQNNRKILFVVDRVGNRGKTFLSLFMGQRYGERHVTLAEMKQHDSAYIVSKHLDLQSTIFDYSRNWKPEYFSWTLFEQLKNGRIASGKYVSQVVNFGGSIKVAVFTNHDPSAEFFRLSSDRIDIIDLDHMFAVHKESLMDLVAEQPATSNDGPTGRREERLPQTSASVSSTPVPVSPSSVCSDSTVIADSP